MALSASSNVRMLKAVLSNAAFLKIAIYQSQEQITGRTIILHKSVPRLLGWFSAPPDIENQYYSFRNGAYLSFKYGFYSELLNSRLR